MVVIETGNYYPNLRGGSIPALDQTGIDSLWVQEQLGLPVVKLFNSILATSIKEKGKLAGDTNRIALAVSGDNTKSKQVAFRMADELGFDSVDLGDIAQSWRQQPGSPIYCRDLNSEEIQKRLSAMETKGSVLSAVISKRRSDEVLMQADYPAYLKTLA